MRGPCCLLVFFTACTRIETIILSSTIFSPFNFVGGRTASLLCLPTPGRRRAPGLPGHAQLVDKDFEFARPGARSSPHRGGPEITRPRERIAEGSLGWPAVPPRRDRGQTYLETHPSLAYLFLLILPPAGAGRITDAIERI